MLSSRETRQKTIKEIIRSQKLATQEAVLAAVQSLGMITTQATLSRDITELGAIKENGYYVLHPASFFRDGLLQILAIKSAGPNLLVVNTPSGAAQAVGLGIDEAKIDGVVGTIGGDDTIFVAISGPKKASSIKREIIKRFQPVQGH